MGKTVPIGGYDVDGRNVTGVTKLIHSSWAHSPIQTGNLTMMFEALEFFCLPVSGIADEFIARRFIGGNGKKSKRLWRHSSSPPFSHIILWSWHNISSFSIPILICQRAVHSFRLLNNYPLTPSSNPASVFFGRSLLLRPSTCVMHTYSS